MTEYRDADLGQALLELPIPPDSSGFWTRLTAELESSTAPTQTEVKSSGKPAEVIELPDSTPPEPGNDRSRVLWLAMAAALIAVVAFGVTRFRSTATTTIDPAATTRTTVSVDSTIPDSADTPRPSDGLTFEELSIAARNATFPSRWSETGELTLVDGVWESEPVDGSAVTRVEIEDVAASATEGSKTTSGLSPSIISLHLLRIDNGGSGTFYDLYLIEDNPLWIPTDPEGELLVVRGPIPLGDRVNVESVVIDPESFIVGFTDRFGEQHFRTYSIDPGLTRLDQPHWYAGRLADTDLACFSVADGEFRDQYPSGASQIVACDERYLDAFLAEQPSAGTLDLVDGYVILDLP